MLKMKANGLNFIKIQGIVVDLIFLRKGFNQLRVLDFAKALTPKGVEGRKLFRFEGAISIDDLRLMSKAIEEGCEKVDIRECKVSS